ncbi:MAG: hypothetical protein J6Z14_02715 [Prevotella sp.]|nr:hypothetical protein [Prevotella sp.]
MPVEKKSSFNTLTVKKQDIIVPVKYSAKMKGRTDVLISPQVSLQLTTAQESLLNVQLNEASNMYSGAQAVMALDIALGGGSK